MTARLALTRAEAAEAVGVSERTLRKAVQAGDLVERYVGSKPVIAVTELESWLASLPTTPRRP